MPRPSQTRVLSVWANGARVGEWRLPSRAAMEFDYDLRWLETADARPLSLSLPLPLDRVPHRGAVVEHYFDNLLPDSEAIRRRLQERFHTPSRAPFDLLAAIGRDCVGAIQLLPGDETPTDIRRIEFHALSDSDIAAELAGVTSPTLAGGDPDEFCISIAGAQEKTALLKHKGRWCRPVGSTPTTHIFKLPLGLVGNRQADMRTSVENEWLCARLVDAFGIPVANCDIAEFGAHKVLIVERFDRQPHSSGKYWLRLMQEDFAQATGTPWHRKYQADGGPGVLELAGILRGSLHAQADLETLFRAQLVFYLLAATDGHAKNFSIRILAGGRFQLTPLYDVLSAWPIAGKRAHEIPPGKLKLAMALPGERPRYLWKSIQRRHFEMLGKKLGLGARAITLMDETLARSVAVIDATAAELPRGFPAAVATRIFEGLRHTARLLGAA